MIIADIGCGRYQYPARGYVRVYAVDNDPEVLKRRQLGVTYIKGSFEEFNLPSGLHHQVDIIYLRAAFHHIYHHELRPFFNQVRLYLKPAGIINIQCDFYVTPMFKVMRALSYLKRGRVAIPNPDYSGNHYRTRYEIEIIFKEFGFEFKMFKTKPDIKRRLRYKRLGWQYYDGEAYVK